ncbi:centrosomal protein of 192 kDa [Excalfactoria chinensis]
MFVARSIAADHRDLIHDVSFDFHGRRMATCSSDQSVKVWDKSENGDWHCTASWKTHSGSVWRVTWAHPEFGQVLASCSFDRTAAVWEEIVGESNDKLRGQSHWVKRTTLVDSRTSVTDVKFAPKHMGLMLATCSADGVVRIYEAPDVMNLSQWSLQHEISCKLSCSCISWNPSSSRAHSPMIAVGSDDNSPNILAKVQIYEYNENTRKYAKAEALMTVTDPVHDIAFAPNLGRSFHILAVATKDVRIFTLKPLRKELTSSGGLTKFEIHIVAQFDNHNSQVWRVSWNITGTVLASSGDDGCVRLWKANYMDNWKCTGILKGNGSPVNGGSQQGIFNASLGSANTSLQNSLNGSSASRYFFPPLDSPRAGSRWSSHAQLLPPPPLIEHSCDAETANLQYPHPRRRCVSRPLNLLPENEGVSPGRQSSSLAAARPALPHLLAAGGAGRNARAGFSPEAVGVLLLLRSRCCRTRADCSEQGIALDKLHSAMESFRNIADETFPSFLGNSLNSSASVLVENVTISSNPGLPVAASTVAKNKAGPDSRLSDIRASYLEDGKNSPPCLSSQSSQSDPEPVGRLAISFHDDVEVATQVKEPQPTIVSLKESYSLPGDQDQNVVRHSRCSQDTLLEVLPLERLEDLPSGICFLPDSKDNKVTPSEPSEKLLETGTSSDRLSISLSSFLENEKLSPLSSLGGDSTDDDIDDEEFFDNQLEAYFEQLIPPDMTRGDNDIGKLSECCTALKLSENGLLQEDFQNPGTYQAVTGADSGSVHDEDSQNQGMTEFPMQIEKLPRAMRQLNSMTSRDVLESCSAAELHLDSLYLRCISSHTADGEGALSKQEVWSSGHHSAASAGEVLHPAEEFLEHYTDTRIPLSADAPGTAAVSAGCEVGLSDTYLSPTADSCQNKSLATTDTGDAPHSVVYQNEEGKWVTDLAYYTSFDEEQDLNLSEDDEINEFITGSEAAAMIAQDQEEFEKTHRLLQAEKVDILNASEIANSSWKSAGSCLLPKMSDVSKDASYLRLSLGEFFGQRSEALGCLGGGSDVKRPSFGYHITSPKTRQPVALLRQFDASVGDATQETSQFSEVFPEDLEAQAKEHADSTSCEGAWCGVEAAAGIQKSVNSETATRSKAKGGVNEDKLEGGLSNHSDSVLSISTIASAIANASCSAEPSQLAAMMMTLSNKNRKKCFLPGIVKETELTADGALSNDVENSAFDMEKYLKKTDEFGHESERESIAKHEAPVQNSMSESTLLAKVRNKEALVEDLSDHNEQQLTEKQFLSYFNAENGTQNISSSSDASKHEDRTANSIKYSEKLSDVLSSKHLQLTSATLKSDMPDTQTLPNRNKAQACETPLAVKREMAQRLLFAQQADNLTSRCSREGGGTVKNPVPEPCNDFERNTRNVSLSNGKATKELGKYVLVSPTKATPVLKLSTDEEMQSSKVEERTQESHAAGSGSVKHVTFEKLSPTSQNSTDHQSVLPECDLQPLEDEQYSFRPSTSPLIHSSPSDASGTACSGSEADFICTSQYPKSSCKEDTVSQSVYSSPSMSRLTYVSESDSTLKNTSVTCDPETRWSENASELSTTIIRASPTPSQEQTKKLEDYLCQRNRKGVQFSVDQKSEENELVHPEGKLEGQGQELSKEDLAKNERQLTSAASKVAATLKELEPAISALASKFCVFQPLPVNAGAQEVWQDHTNKAQTQGLPSLNTLPVYPGLSACVPINQNTPSEQYIPVSSFKSHVTTSESQTISSVPTLLPGHSLATAQFAQHHLGNVPSTGNKILPQFHGCSSAGLSVPPSGLPYSSISAELVENSVPVGIPLGSNIGPGSLGTAALCHPPSTSWNKNILNIRSYTAQHLGTSRKEWDFSMPPGVGHVKVPEELKFPNACCVGIASQTVLSIFNPTERWLQVSIGILSISVNGEKVDPAKYQCLVFKNKTIVGPHSTDDLKILFLPCHSGIFQCILSVSSWSVSADAEIVVQAEALSSRVVLTAVAENPNLEVETGKQDYLDFGDLTSGSWKALPLKIINKTHAFVPIRLIINANAVAWRCFTFSKEPVNSSNDQSLQRDAVSQAAAPSVVNHVIHASYDGQDPEVLTVWVLFHAPKKQISCSDTLGPAEEFLARVDVEVDSPGPSSVIQSVLLRARAGTARIHAPKDLQTIHLSAGVGSTAEQQLPLKNAGNIGVNLKLKISEQDSFFSVEPDDLFLLPGEEREVTVKFSPKNVASTQSVLKIIVLPSGPQYEVVIKGETESLENRPASTAAADIPPILSNKQFVAWGGVKLGESVQQKLTLRNNSPSVTQHLRLVIRGQDQDCFQLQSIFGSEERLTSNWELKIRPKEDTNIYLMFTPTRVTSFFAKLEIKQLGIISQPGIKFTIPLSGYGGTSSVILESVKKLSDGYTLTLDGLLPSRLKRVSFRIRNTGSRAAYVKALCFANLQTKTVVDPQVMTVSPEKFILKEGTHEMITVTWNPAEKERIPLKAKTLLSTICFFCGDEISRQRYRRAMMCELEVAKPIVPENSLLRNIVFDEEFQGEQLVTEVCDIPRGTNDIRLFYANMRKIILTVVGYFVNQDVFQQPSGHCLESNRSENAARLINATLDVLPVKGPQGPPLHVKINDGIQNKVEAEQTWAVKPEQLILLPPSISGTADTGQVEIVNSSSRMLTFELSWPAHCLTITPQHGVIEPESRALILVSPNPSLATKPSVIPWSGLIYIHCDNEQKFVKVQIREAQNVSGTSSPSRRRDLFTLQSASPAVHVAKPLSAHPLTKMEIKNRSIVFPETRSGECTESYLEMENKGDENVRWNLSSFTPPYVKAMDETGSVCRATYSAFRCCRVSGTLEAHGNEKVAFIFLPRENGDYSQFWDLECHPAENPSWKHKLRFQLSGTGTEAENTAAVMRASADTRIETGSPVMSRRKVSSKARTNKAGLNEITYGVYAPEESYTFLPTRVGESRTLKVNLRNNSFRTHLLKFLTPKEPFYIKHSKYSLRAHHYINVPVRFKPQAEGIFEGLLVVHTDKYSYISIRLCGKAIAKE